MLTRRELLAALSSSAFLACSGSGSNPAPMSPALKSKGPLLSEASLAKYQALKAEVEVAHSVNAQGLLSARNVRNVAQLSYDPKQGKGLDLIQASPLGLSQAELAKLGEHGFVVSARQQFPTFVRGYAAIYQNHLPIYVSADALLESVHRSYDQILLAVEQGALIGELKEMFTNMRSALASTSFDPAIVSDADLYLAVALSLLEGKLAPPVAGADVNQVSSLVEKAKAAQGLGQALLFGATRIVDFSQFKPRGHYTSDPALEQYFRAMMWLGRVDLMLIETLPTGAQVFHRPQYDAMLLFNGLLSGAALAHWQTIETAIATFVGESDYMRVPEVGSLVQDLGGIAAARSATDTAIVEAIVKGAYGEQQIASHIQFNDTEKELPLGRSFAILGQRYIVDSQVLSEVVYGRVLGRLMPDPLDAAFAALGNDQAAQLLAPQLREFDPGYPGALNAVRTLVDSHEDTFWSANFYNLWLKALRALSPSPDMKNVANRGMPEVTGTEAWGRRVLNTQLGSWAELRHDNLLYAKQSYTDFPSCEFPDAYVEPYPEFFKALEAYADQGVRMAAIAQMVSPYLASRVTSYFQNLTHAANVLGAMAESQRQGTIFTAEQMAFINDAVIVKQEAAGCVSVETPNGWLTKLFFDQQSAIVLDPTIADVHTQPGGPGGEVVGKVLHVGTAYPRLMVTTVDTCMGPRSYVGMVFSYHEQVTENFLRKTDEEWANEIATTPPAEVPWMTDLLGPQ